MLTYKSLLEAKRRGDETAINDLSFRLATERLRSTGLRDFAIVMVLGETVSRDRLVRVLRSMGLGNFVLHITWKNLDNDELVTERVYLVPMSDPKQIVALKYNASSFSSEIFDSDFDLAATIQSLYPGWRLAEVDLPPAAFIEAVALMNADTGPIARNIKVPDKLI